MSEQEKWFRQTAEKDPSGLLLAVDNSKNLNSEEKYKTTVTIIACVYKLGARKLHWLNDSAAVTENMGNIENAASWIGFLRRFTPKIWQKTVRAGKTEKLITDLSQEFAQISEN